MAIVSALYVYPIKSCRGIQVDEWPVVERGFACDRRWLIVDGAGQFVTQRERPILSLVRTALEGSQLHLSAPGLPELTLPIAHELGQLCRVKVWNDEVLAVPHAEGSAWFERYLGARHQLVYMPDSQPRPINPKYARAGEIVGFADGYPFLVVSEASLAALNARLQAPLTMARFRPNIVISGSEPFAEDGYARVRLGELTFRGPKLCDRCVITCIDPETGEQGKEPLRTLAQFRQADQKVSFGMNLIHEQLGMLRVGDAVTALDGVEPTPSA